MNDVLASGPMNSDADGENATRTAGVSGLYVIRSHAKTHGDKQITSQISTICVKGKLWSLLFLYQVVPNGETGGDEFYPIILTICAPLP